VKIHLALFLPFSCIVVMPSDMLHVVVFTPPEYSLVDLLGSGVRCQILFRRITAP
jgi:hypothetical protein